MRLHGFLIGQTETLLAEVLKLNGPADATTSRFFRAHPKLGHGERGVIAEAVFAVLRRGWNSPIWPKAARAARRAAWPCWD